MIEQEAEQLASFENWENPSDFNDKLTLKLYEYDDDQDKLIFLYKTHAVRNEALAEHKKRCTSVGCRVDMEITKELYFIEKEIKALNPNYKFQILRQNVNIGLVKKNLVDLASYPQAGKHYQSAMDKLNEGKFERNLVDDLRLCIETLLKSILANDKSIENQYSPLGQYLETRNISVELRNLFIKQLEYYAKWHNENVKHNDKVKELEIDLVINISSTFISFLLQSSKS